VLTAIKQYLMQGFPVQIDAPSKVSLFAYDNHTLVVESFLDQPVQVTVTALGSFAKARNLASGETVEGKTPVSPRRWRREPPEPPKTEFHIEIAPHSFAAFSEE